MPIRNAIASLAVKDIRISVRWYETLLQRPPDSRLVATLAEWKFEGGGWLQVYELQERAGHCSCTLSVSSMKEQIESLVALRVDVSNTTSDDMVKTLMITDPDGNHIAFAEAIDPTIAR